MLSVQDVSRTFSTPTGDVMALADVNLEIAAGEFVSIVGPSGCGKSTLLRVIAGLERPTSGMVAIDGEPVRGPGDGLAVVFQEYGRSLFGWRSVGANVALGARLSTDSRAARRERTEESLRAVGLWERAGSYPWQLSGGMQQRVAIARAIASRPRVLLMDEPFAAVDAQTREDLEDLVRGLWQRLGTTVIFVTHDIDEAIYLGQRVVVLGTAPQTVRSDIAVGLPEQRDQLTTRALDAFMSHRTELRTAVVAAHA